MDGYYKMLGAFLFSLAGLAISIVLIYAIMKVGNMSKTTRWILAALVGLFMLLPSLAFSIYYLFRLI
jgi:hypothetical protein